VIGLVLGNLGSVYLEGGRYDDEALACYAASLRMALEIGDWMAASYTLHNLALLHMRLDDWSMTDALLERAETLARSQRNDDLLCDCAFTRGRMLLLRGDADAARALLGEAVRLAEAVERDDVVSEAGALQAQLNDGENLETVVATLRDSLIIGVDDTTHAELPAVPAVALRNRVSLSALLEQLDGISTTTAA
jgi:tetratricopeptide (TPR) repeat protein